MIKTSTNFARVADLILRDAPPYTFLEALDSYEVLQSGAVIFKDYSNNVFLLSIVGGPDAYRNTPELLDLPVRILEPGDSFTITIEDD